MFRRPIKEINAEYIAEEKYLDSIQRTIRESCTAASMSKRDTSAVLLAVEEGATNIIRHAYLYEKGVIRLRVVIYRSFVVFSLIDYGRSFQASSEGAIDLERLVESGRKGGLGFYMIKKIMDSVEYISTAGFNELRMIKRLADSSPVSAPFLRRLFGLRVRFSIWTFVIMAIIIGASIYYFDYQTSLQMYKHKDETVQALATTIAAQSAGYFINSRSDVEFDELVVSYKQANPELRQIVLTDAANLIRGHSDDIHNIRKPYALPGAIDSAVLNRPQFLLRGNEHLNYLITPVTTGERRLGTVHVTYSSAMIHERILSARRNILLLSIVLIGVGILGIYVLSNRFVRPIVNITRRVRRFTSGDLETELPLEGEEEFFEISRAFNQMMTRLSQDRKNIVERERLAKEIEVASQIQQTLLPRRLPDIPNLEVQSFYRAASIVGGDLYDVFPIGGSRYCLTVADVSGKGVPASLVMSMLRTVIRIHATDARSARELLVRVNDFLTDNIPSGMFITMFLIIYDSSRGTARCVSAGHNPMLLCSARRRQLERINPQGMPLGVPLTGDTVYANELKEVELQLDPGDLMLLYTDGVTEARGRDGGHFGIDRLRVFLEQAAFANERPALDQLSADLISSLDDYTGFARATDDISYLLIRFTGLAAETVERAAIDPARREAPGD